MEWLNSLKWSKEEDKKLVESHLRVMSAINQEISTTNDMVKEIFESDDDAQLLATIPGIGLTLAMLISTEIDGIERFCSPSKLCSYAGLVPSIHSSGGKTYHGKIAFVMVLWYISNLIRCQLICIWSLALLIMRWIILEKQTAQHPRKEAQNGKRLA